jgi:hypothetical protein
MQIGFQAPVKPAVIPAPVRFGWLPEARQEARQEALEYATIRKKEAEPPKAPPVNACEYRYNFNPDVAWDFLETTFTDDSSGLSMTGRDFLRFLITPDAVDTQNLPDEKDWRFFDLHKAGRTDTELWQFLADRVTGESPAGKLKFVDSFCKDLLTKARLRGLVYKLTDPENPNKVYFGVPYDVQRLLGLNTEYEADMGQAAQTFASAVADFVPQGLALPDSDELFDYTAQIAQKCIENGTLEKEQLSQECLDKMESFGALSPRSFNVLIDLLESSAGTPLFEPAKKLCQLAAQADLLSADEVADTLALYEG